MYSKHNARQIETMVKSVRGHLRSCTEHAWPPGTSQNPWINGRDLHMCLNAYTHIHPLKLQTHTIYN